MPTGGQGLPIRNKSSTESNDESEEKDKWSPARHQEAVDALMGTLAGGDFEGAAEPPKVFTSVVLAHKAIHETAVVSVLDSSILELRTAVNPACCASSMCQLLQASDK